MTANSTSSRVQASSTASGIDIRIPASRLIQKDNKDGTTTIKVGETMLQPDIQMQAAEALANATGRTDLPIYVMPEETAKGQAALALLGIDNAFSNWTTMANEITLTPMQTVFQKEQRIDSAYQPDPDAPAGPQIR
ncbi:MAG: hypothetical protein OXU45_04735 [Candidatus Melainabacteria bacterium]|nr:hypothetical protein [Candidatus Melainabacteria bacterium]